MSLENWKKRWEGSRLNPWAEIRSETEEEEQIWLITLSDLMSLLLVFFIIFVALSQTSLSKKGSRSVPAENVPVEMADPTSQSIEREMQAVVASLGLGDEVSVQAGPREILITLREAITFPSGEDRVLFTSFPVLDAVARLIKDHPAYQVEIEGHTDDRPIRNGRFPSNWELSVARSASVLRYLIENHGLDPARFTIKGYGEQRPLVPNLTEEQRTQNRRVEIRLKKGTEMVRSLIPAEGEGGWENSQAEASKISRTF